MYVNYLFNVCSDVTLILFRYLENWNSRQADKCFIFRNVSSLANYDASWSQKYNKNYKPYRQAKCAEILHLFAF
jgi:hypothetical protein